MDRSGFGAVIGMASSETARRTLEVPRKGCPLEQKNGAVSLSGPITPSVYSLMAQY